ncbi:hypothetical protein [Romboutsia sp. 13368]|uniref:hypothetical protein n=1 Tax=Romboutsia sp. 13368 TaxID=2708053 RepID=UPI0025EBDA17|nr:hypothetical protein [Romboutsia sp. 13368]
MNINLVYIYPKTIEINNEMNLLRIVDKVEKESLVMYSTKENENYKICMINTYTGENIYIVSYKKCGNRYKVFRKLKRYRKIHIKINKKLKKLKIIRIFDKMSE